MIPSMMQADLFGAYYTNVKLTDVWSEAATFVNDCQNCGIPMPVTEQSLTTLFYLLYARYGNDIIASSDVNRFKYAVYSIIFESGGTWQRKIEIQDSLRKLTESDLMTGSTQIYNNATNPGTKVDDTGLLSGINNQNQAFNKRDKMNAYGMLYETLRDDVTSTFLSKFNKLFLKVVAPQVPLWYATPISEEEEQ